MSPLSREQVEESRQKLLKTVIQHISKYGPQFVTMRKVAESAKVSLPVLYRYFDSKEDMLEKAFLRMSDDMQKALSKNLENVGKKWGEWERLCQYGVNYIEYAIENSNSFKHFFSILPGEYFSSKPVVEKGVWRPLAILKEMVKNCIESNVLEGDAELISYMLWTHVHGMSYILVDAHKSHNKEHLSLVFKAFLYLSTQIFDPRFLKKKASLESKAWMEKEFERIINKYFKN